VLAPSTELQVTLAVTQPLSFKNICLLKLLYDKIFLCTEGIQSNRLGAHLKEAMYNRLGAHLKEAM